mmetsp:Transcript_14996/g.41205  ORF Transcript_14996/g.41205 Transcript_14996/m.41205 type:complete len:214 (-) Transcript_14996:759-1400(-)
MRIAGPTAATIRPPRVAHWRRVARRIVRCSCAERLRHVFPYRGSAELLERDDQDVTSLWDRPGRSHPAARRHPACGENHTQLVGAICGWGGGLEATWWRRHASAFHCRHPESAGWRRHASEFRCHHASAFHCRDLGSAGWRRHAAAFNCRDPEAAGWRRHASDFHCRYIVAESPGRRHATRPPGGRGHDTAAASDRGRGHGTAAARGRGTALG